MGGRWGGGGRRAQLELTDASSKMSFDLIVLVSIHLKVINSTQCDNLSNNLNNLNLKQNFLVTIVGHQYWSIPFDSNWTSLMDID